MSRFSIFIRLIFLATALIGVLFVSNVLLGRELSRNAQALANRMNDLYENLDSLAEVMFMRFTEPAILPVDSGYLAR